MNAAPPNVATLTKTVRRSFVRLFKPRFAALVANGKKIQTVRPTPKRLPEYGDRISLRTWMGKPYRSKQEILREATISCVCPIEIDIQSETIALDGRQLDLAEMVDFARDDGFDEHWLLFDWLQQEYRRDKFEGIVIYWNI